MNLVVGNAIPSGIASTQDCLYVLDQDIKKVYRYSYSGEMLGISGELRGWNGSSLGNPSGLAITGDVMWVVLFGPNNPLLYKYSVEDAFSSTGYIEYKGFLGMIHGNRKASGLAMDNTYLYVVDRDNERIYRYPRNPFGGGFYNISYKLKGVNGSDLIAPSGAMCDGSSIWVVDQGTSATPGKIYQYSLNSLFLDYATIQNTLAMSSDIALDTEEAVYQVFGDYYWYTVNAIAEYSLDGRNDNPTGM